MPGSQTTHIKLLKPEISGDANVWGDKLNEDMDLLEAYLVETRTAQLQALYNGKVGELYNLEDPARPMQLDHKDFRTALLPLFYADNLTSLETTQGQALVTRNMVQKLLDTVVPTGTIIAWSGSPGLAQGSAPDAMPIGWRLCNQDVTIPVENANPPRQIRIPNLLGRFIMGTDREGGTGVSFTPGWNHFQRQPAAVTLTMADFRHTHNVPGGSHVLTTREIPGHTHNENSAGDAGYAIHVPKTAGAYWFGPNGTADKLWTQGNIGTGEVGTNLAGGAADAHVHNSTVSATQLNDVPGIPWYTLCYIIKIRDCYGGG